MATTADDVKKGDEDYASAFNEDQAAPAQQSDDEAFGLHEPEAAPADGAPTAPSAPVAVIIDTAKDGEEAGQTDAEAQGDQPGQSEDAPVRSDGEPGDGGVPSDLAKPGEAAVEAKPAVEMQAKSVGANGAPMNEQQLRSWEGRLKKAQADLDAAQKSGKAVSSDGTGDEDGDTPKGAPNATSIDALEQVEDTAKNPAMAKEAGDLADKVESGEMDPEAAMKQLTEDFGGDFVNMIVSIAKKIAGEAGGAAADSKLGEVKGAVSDIVGHINDREAKAHFSAIAAKHPDFDDVGKSQGFKDWVEAHGSPDEMKRIANGGSPEEINKMLDEYKASQAEPQAGAAPEAEAAKPAADPVVAKQMDDAEGVRSAGMALPEQPKKASDGYEDAWNEFA